MQATKEIKLVVYVWTVVWFFLFFFNKKSKSTRKGNFHTPFISTDEEQTHDTLWHSLSA